MEYLTTFVCMAGQGEITDILKAKQRLYLIQMDELGSSKSLRQVRIKTISTM